MSRMSVKEARLLGEGAHALVHFGGTVRPELVVQFAEALATLWAQERALRIEVAKLQDRCGIERRAPAQR